MDQTVSKSTTAVKDLIRIVGGGIYGNAARDWSLEDGQFNESVSQTSSLFLGE